MLRFMVENGLERDKSGRGRPVQRPLSNERMPGLKRWAGGLVGGLAIFWGCFHRC